MFPVLSAGQDSMVTLRSQSLNIRQLVEEAARQTGVNITIDLREDDGPTLPYDCRSSLREILDGVRGYFAHSTGMDLLETWTGEESVHLHFKTMETEIIAVQVEGRDPVPAPKIEKKVEEKPSKKWFFKNSKSGRGNRNVEAPLVDTPVKHMDLDEELKGPEDHPLEEVPETIPTRLQVETLSPDDVLIVPGLERSTKAAASGDGKVKRSLSEESGIAELPDLSEESLGEKMGIPSKPKSDDRENSPLVDESQKPDAGENKNDVQTSSKKDNSMISDLNELEPLELETMVELEPQRAVQEVERKESGVKPPVANEEISDGAGELISLKEKDVLKSSSDTDVQETESIKDLPDL